MMMDSRKFKEDEVEHESRLLVYNSRMKYIKGHAHANSRWNVGVWTNDRPVHVEPRIKFPLRRPKTAPGGGTHPHDNSIEDEDYAEHTAAVATEASMEKFKGILKLPKERRNLLAPLEERLKETRKLNIAKAEADARKRLHKAALQQRSEYDKEGEEVDDQLYDDTEQPPGPGSWKRLYQAGVWFWINNQTGIATTSMKEAKDSMKVATDPPSPKQLPPAVVTPIPPIVPAGPKWGKSAQPRLDEMPPGELDESRHWGTGSLAYNSSEFDDFMRILDLERLKKKKKKSKKARPKSAPGTAMLNRRR